ncbi:hypothetical protein Pcinc_009525 [Petrolisthes cinctipes]|uniref:Uncharacterized protein n=1 Tax=Petrolisthes cinctipes TaxID=88211 RepID=A0AAE1G783_PETCI|nr:hypothetical protein Pcinc_009525 [Petrolisthes cinctipes]
MAKISLIKEEASRVWLHSSVKKPPDSFPSFPFYNVLFHNTQIHFPFSFPPTGSLSQPSPPPIKFFPPPPPPSSYSSPSFPPQSSPTIFCLIFLFLILTDPSRNLPILAFSQLTNSFTTCILLSSSSSSCSCSFFSSSFPVTRITITNHFLLLTFTPFLTHHHNHASSLSTPNLHSYSPHPLSHFLPSPIPSTTTTNPPLHPSTPSTTTTNPPLRSPTHPPAPPQPQPPTLPFTHQPTQPPPQPQPPTLHYTHQPTHLHPSPPHPSPPLCHPLPLLHHHHHFVTLFPSSITTTLSPSSPSPSPPPLCHPLPLLHHHHHLVTLFPSSITTYLPLSHHSFNLTSHSLPLPSSSYRVGVVGVGGT